MGGSVGECMDGWMDGLISCSNLVPRASVTLVQRNGRRRLWNNPKPEPENSSSG